MLPPLFTRSRGLGKLYGQMFVPVLEQWMLTQLEADILLFLANTPAYDTARDIVERRYIAKSHVSMGVESLARRGLLQRDTRPGNRKTIHLRLTEAAEPIVEAGRAVQARYGQALLAGFTDRERETLMALLNRVAENVDAALAEAERSEP